MISHYETLTGRRIDLAGFSDAERHGLAEILTVYGTRPAWTTFSTAWQAQLTKALPTLPSKARRQHRLYMVCQDLELRLGIVQGAVAPPDYRDYLLARIEEKFGSRYRFCKETGIPEAFLSQVLSGKKDFSLSKLREAAEALGLGIVLLPVLEMAEVPVTDLGALRRVSSLLTMELSTLRTALDHFGRIADPEARVAALGHERDLFGNMLDWIEERLRTVPKEVRGERLLAILQEEIAAKERFLNALRTEIARRVDPVSQPTAGGMLDACQAVSGV